MRIGYVLLLLVALAIPSLAAAEQQAVVSGAQRVFIRRGPGTDFQPFATVERGEQVEVEEVAGAWALVRTESGERGYVHGFYLAYLDGSTVATESPTPPGEPEPSAAQATTLQQAAREPAPVPIEQNAEILAQLRELRAEVGALRDGDAPSEDLVALRAEVGRLADTTAALRTRLDSPGGAMSALPGAGEWSTSALFGASLATLVFGWLVGGAVARRQERRGRTRIRF